MWFLLLSWLFKKRQLVNLITMFPAKFSDWDVISTDDMFLRKNVSYNISTQFESPLIILDF